MDVLFFTGFPGFLGSALLPRLLKRRPGVEAVALVPEAHLPHARRRLGEIDEGEPGLAGRVRLATGDLTAPGLGLEPGALDPDRVVEIHHLAALYDVAGPRDRLRRVNVEGTKRVLELAGRCGRLGRLHHVSTCYVSGRHPGTFREDQLHGAGPFNNAYEETKHLAEAAVRERMEAGLPATIYRPAMVVGDSGSGATQKADGPYFVVRLLLRQPRVAALPVVGNPKGTRVNVVPRDFVVDAIAHLSALEAARGRCYQLADPDPPTLEEALEALIRAVGKPVVRVRLPTGLAKGLLAGVPGLERWLGIPRQALDYFSHPTDYDTSRAREDLAGTGIRVPRFADYVDRLVRFLREHPDLAPDAMA
ncbi:MAG TPA: SDR family oxidoreductase [Longimicrobiales bacterium]|nr:SDR family oxidoreductase [Longimicrobiales bacterium]